MLFGRESGFHSETEVSLASTGTPALPQHPILLTVEGGQCVNKEGEMGLIRRERWGWDGGVGQGGVGGEGREGWG